MKTKLSMCFIKWVICISITKIKHLIIVLLTDSGNGEGMCFSQLSIVLLSRARESLKLSFLTIPLLTEDLPWQSHSQFSSLTVGSFLYHSIKKSSQTPNPLHHFLYNLKEMECFNL